MMDAYFTGFFQNESIADFTTIYLTGAAVTYILSYALYKLIATWAPQLNGRLFQTIIAAVSIVTVISYWLYVEHISANLLYVTFAAFVMWAIIYITVSTGAKKMLEMTESGKGVMGVIRGISLTTKDKPNDE